MNKTPIDWCDYSWNPVTGCYNDCFYCYAKKIAERFDKGYTNGEKKKLIVWDQSRDAFPRGFIPTLYPYRLDDPQKVKKPSKIFVCSMADLFGDWIPDEWIEQVFDACRKAPQHTYLFLTKNPRRCVDLSRSGILPIDNNFWFGTTVTKQTDEFFLSILGTVNCFISLEPIMGAVTAPDNSVVRSGDYFSSDWLIFGAMTKNGKVVKEYRPKWEWIKDLVIEARERGIPIFMKQSMKGIVPNEQFTQEFPKEMRRRNE